MYRGRSIAVVVPAFNEARAIARTIRAVPRWVDRIIVVDDASGDDTFEHARRVRRKGLEVLRHPANRGVGGAIITGYRRVLALGLDIAAVMAGDGQMHPADLPALLDAIVDGHAGYAKGNRFVDRRHPVWREMPWTRIAGNVLMSLATKVVSGLWHVFDSQCGYTAIDRAALSAIDLDRVFPRYGYPNDVLARMHAARVAVVDVPVRPIYGAQWKSGIRLRTLVHPIPWVLLRAWAHRLRVEWVGAPPALQSPVDAEPQQTSAER